MGRGGYTLVELVVVVLIIGILAAFGVPQYLRTVETSKADDAVSTVNMIGTTNRMFALDHSGEYAAGTFSGSCSGACPAAGPYGACALVQCKYLAAQDWGSRPYIYYACDPASGCAVGGAGKVSGAARRNSASSPYSSWAYAMDTQGAITGYGTSVPAPTY